MKKLLSLTLCFVLVLLTIPIGTVFAVDFEVLEYGMTGDCKWTIDADYTLTISGSGKMGDYSREYVSGKIINTAPWGEHIKEIKKVIIENSVTYIGNYAFYGCTGLTSITIPNSVISIESSAFEHCTGLKSITIPNSVTSIGGYAFYNCTGLTSITIGNGVTNIGDYAFYNCIELTEINYNAKSVVDLPYHSHNPYFFYNAGISGSGIKVIFGDNVERIPEYLFYIGVSSHCPKIISVTIGNSVTSIGYSAFKDCTELVSITIPSSLTNIDDYAFYNCTGLTEINYNAKSIIRLPCTDVFYNAGMNGSGIKVVFGDTVEKIPADLFSTNLSSHRPKIISVTIGNSVTSIGSLAFSSLENIEVNSNNPTYSTKDGVLFDKNQTTLLCCPAEKSESYVIPDGVTSIGDSAFYGCHRLISVAIPNTVTRIGDSAFFGCNNLQKVYYNGTIDQWKQIVYYSANSNLTDCLKLMCDFDDDKILSANDLVTLRKGLMNILIPDDFDILGDINSDGTVNILDLIRMKKYFLNAS